MTNKINSAIIIILAISVGILSTILHVHYFYDYYKLMSPENALELSKSLIEVNGFIISFSIVINFFLLSKINDFRDKTIKVTFPPIKHLMILIDKTKEKLSKLENSGDPKTNKVNDDIKELKSNLNQYEPALIEYEISFNKLKEVTQDQSKHFLYSVITLIVFSMLSIILSFWYLITQYVLNILGSIQLLIFTVFMEIVIIYDYNTTTKLLDDGLYDLTKHLIKLKLEYEKNIKELEYK